MVGRKEELSTLKSLQQDDESAFVAVYGRRRVGKTYLIRHVFDGKFSFYITGIANISLEAQLTNFYAGLMRYFPAPRPNQTSPWHQWHTNTLFCMDW